MNILGDKTMRIKVNGIHMNYKLSGKEGAPVVVLSHSLGSSLAMWDPQMETLTSKARLYGLSVVENFRIASGPDLWPVL
jgi:pimeloyl-ACP methyl ester carboxylesterase